MQKNLKFKGEESGAFKTCLIGEFYKVVNLLSMR